MNNLIFIFLVVGLISCESVQQENTNDNESEMSVNHNTMEVDTTFWVMDGNRGSDTVLLICGGGPKWHLDIVKKGKTNYRYIPRYKEYGIAYLHQSQTINGSIFTSKTVISLDKAMKLKFPS